MKPIIGPICLFTLTLGLLPALSPGKQTTKQRKDGLGWSRDLNVIVLESMNVKTQIPKAHFEVISLPAADLPIRISKTYLPLTTSAKFMANDLDLPGEVTILDIYTFHFSEKNIDKAKAMKRGNDFVELSYSVKLRSWADDSCQIEFAGKYHGSLTSVTTRLARETTTLIRVDRLCFAFTFVDAAIRADEAMHSAKRPDPGAGFSLPKLMVRGFPMYPPELRGAKQEGKFLFLGIINRNGKVDRSHGIVLECFHWLFARNALETIFNDWEFVPCKFEDQPVDAIANMEVIYQIMR